MKTRLSLVLLALALGGCGSDKTATHSTTPHATGPPAYRRITWVEATTLIRRCRVRAVGQTHRDLVTLSLRDGRRQYTYEPGIDDVVDVVNQASRKCGPITFATE